MGGGVDALLQLPRPGGVAFSRRQAAKPAYMSLKACMSELPSDAELLPPLLRAAAHAGQAQQRVAGSVPPAVLPARRAAAAAAGQPPHGEVAVPPHPGGQCHTPAGSATHRRAVPLMVKMLNRHIHVGSAACRGSSRAQAAHRGSSQPASHTDTHTRARARRLFWPRSTRCSWTRATAGSTPTACACPAAPRTRSRCSTRPLGGVWGPRWGTRWPGPTAE